jgi:hypothetical protein
LSLVKTDFVTYGLLTISTTTLILFFYIDQVSLNDVRGDGFSSESLPPFTMNGEKLFLFVKFSPSIINVSDTQNRYLDLKIIDYVTEESVQNVSYQIKIDKDNKVILNGKFHSEPGPLKIKIVPKGGDTAMTNLTSISDGIWRTSTGNVSIGEPVFLTTGLYHLSIKILGVENNMSKNIGSASGFVFDSWLSVADIKNTTAEKNGKTFNITITSFYDRISGLTFDPSSRAVAWSMPFDWNMTRSKHQNILVHEEVRIPKSLFNGSPLQYGAFVNGMALFGRSLTIDPFSSQNFTIAHLLINKQEIMKLLNQDVTNINNKRMAFNLTFLQAPKLQSSSELETDNGEVFISLSGIPERLVAKSNTTLLIGFKDPATGVPINADVTYGVKIFDPNGNSIYDEDSKTTIYNTTSKINVSFPKKGIYQIWMRIEGLAPLDSDVLDISRNGVARGYLLVE